MDVEFTDKKEVSCDGGKYYGHPLVYFKMNNNQTSCSYCGKIFKIHESK
ncbi:MAG: zinc-finger domain-containing protein [Rickettsiales bacterium]|nr:MAG: zinc-finger domain-containing protein [Rickettsiales bacterium]